MTPLEINRGPPNHIGCAAMQGRLKHTEAQRDHQPITRAYCSKMHCAANRRSEHGQ